MANINTALHGNKIANPEHRLSNFDKERLRFGAWGVIKGRLLAEIVGEEQALVMFQAVHDRLGFKRLMKSINLYFQAALAFVDPDKTPAFIDEKKEKILQELEVPLENYPYIHLFPDGKMQFSVNWENHFDFSKGRQRKRHKELAGRGLYH